MQGFLSGLPFAAVTTTLQVRFIDDNASIVLIGFLSLISQIYILKFIIAPIFDSYQPPFFLRYFGKYKGWVFLHQIGIICSFTAMGLISAITHPYFIIAAAVSATLFSAMQDVNIDSLRIQTLGTKNLVTGSAFYLTAFRIGSLISGGLAIYFKPYINWRIIYLIFAGIFIAGINACFLKTKEQFVKPQASQPFKLIYDAYKDLFDRPYIILLLSFVLCYGLGDALTVSVNNIFLLKYLKISMQDLALYANFLNLVMLLISATIARFCFKKLNAFYATLSFGCLQSMMICMYLLLAHFGNIPLLTITAILSEGLTGGLVASAVIFVISSIVRAPYTATQYALFSAMAALSVAVLGPVSALIVKYFSWQTLYSLSLCCSLPGLIIIFCLRHFLKAINGNSTKA